MPGCELVVITAVDGVLGSIPTTNEAIAMFQGLLYALLGGYLC